MVYRLVPNVKQLEHNLQQFATILDADEVLLFEKATFLVQFSSYVVVYDTCSVMINSLAVTLWNPHLAVMSDSLRHYD